MKDFHNIDKSFLDIFKITIPLEHTFKKKLPINAITWEYLIPNKKTPNYKTNNKTKNINNDTCILYSLNYII